MRRRDFVVFGAATLAMPFAAMGQGKTPVIGLLWNDSVKPSPYVATLLGALKEKGYVAGRDFRIEDRVALEGYGPMAEGAAALVSSRVDLIVAFGRTATVAAAKATKEIPVVAIIGADPVAIGLAASLARPGGNVTGVATLAADLVGKRIELLKELVPGLSHVGILLASGAAGVAEITRNAKAAAQALGLQPHIVEVRSPADLEGAIADLAKARIGGLYVTGSSMLAHSARVVAAVAKQRIPAVYFGDRFVDAGGLMVYGPSVHKSFARAAVYVDRILKGARAGELPIEQSDVFDLTVNLKTARAQGIKVPQTILLRADRVIE